MAIEMNEVDAVNDLELKGDLVYTAKEMQDVMTKCLQLNKQLANAESVIRFYGDVENWLGLDCYREEIKMSDIDYYEEYKESGGKRARNYFKEKGE